MKTAFVALAVLALCVSAQATVPTYQANFAAGANAILAGTPTPQIDVVATAQRDIDIDVSENGFSIFWSAGPKDTNAVGVSHGWPTNYALGDLPLAGDTFLDWGMDWPIMVDALIGTTNEGDDAKAVLGIGVSVNVGDGNLRGKAGFGVLDGDPTLYIGIGGDWSG